MAELKIAVVKTMTSLEIAEMTGKQHRNVRTDIAKMISDMGDEASGFSEAFPEERNERQPSGNMAEVYA